MFRTARRGYTLVEVLVVVVILGLAGAILVPVLGGRGDFDTQAAVRQLVADITFAQSDALANQEYRRIHFFADGSGWCLVRLDEDALRDEFDPAVADYVDDPLAGGGKGGGAIVRLDASDRYASVRVERVSLDGDGRDLTFDALGGTVAGDGDPGLGGTIVLRSNEAAYQLALSPLTGKVRVTRLPDAPPDAPRGSSPAASHGR